MDGDIKPWQVQLRDKLYDNGSALVELAQFISAARANGQIDPDADAWAAALPALGHIACGLGPLLQRTSEVVPMPAGNSG